MNHISALCILTSVLCLTGCAYRGVETPLQPGDKIIFQSEGHARAQQFRTASGNDAAHTNRVVQITVPTTVHTE